MSRQQIPVQIPVKLEWKVDHIAGDFSENLDVKLQKYLNDITSKEYNVSSIVKQSTGVLVVSVKQTLGQIAQASSLIGG